MFYICLINVLFLIQFIIYSIPFMHFILQQTKRQSIKKKKHTLLIYPVTSQSPACSCGDLCSERQQQNTLVYHFTCMSAKTYCRECLPGTFAKPQLYVSGNDPPCFIWHSANWGIPNYITNTSSSLHPIHLMVYMNCKPPLILNQIFY